MQLLTIKYNCTRELIPQFNEVRQLNPRLSKPFLHVTLSLAKAESLPNYKLAEMARDCAHDLSFSNNQEHQQLRRPDEVGFLAL